MEVTFMFRICFDYLIEDAIVDPKKIWEIEEAFSYDSWKWESYAKVDYATFAGVTFTLSQSNRLVSINLEEYCYVCDDGDIFALELSKALVSGSIILKFHYPNDTVDPWGFKVEPNKVQLLELTFKPVREVTEEDIGLAKQLNSDEREWW
jgi:hypothetical protein